VTSLEAHVPRAGIGTMTELHFEPGKIRLALDLSYSTAWSRTEMERMDSDRNGSVNASEAEAYLEFQWRKRVEPRLRFSIDGNTVVPKKLAQRYDGPTGEVRSSPLSFYFDLEIELPARGLPKGAPSEGGPSEGGPSEGGRPSGRMRTLEFENRVVRDETRSPAIYRIPFAGQGNPSLPALRFHPQFVLPEQVLLEADAYVLQGRQLTVRFRFEEIVPAETAPSPPQPSPFAEAAPVSTEPDRRGLPANADAPDTDSAEPPETVRAKTSVLVAALRPAEDGGPTSSAAVLILLALVWGAGYTLRAGPPGGALIAYWLGSPIPLAEGARLAVLTSAVQVGSAALFACCLHAWPPGEVVGWPESGPEPLLLAGRLVSGLLLLGIGGVLFLRQTASEGPNPAEPTPPKRRERVAVAFAGGMASSPEVLAATRVALENTEQRGLALGLAVAFGLGGAATLVALALFFISGRKIVSLQTRVIRRLAPLTSLAIVGFGAYLIANSAHGGADELRALLHWVVPKRASGWLP